MRKFGWKALGAVGMFVLGLGGGLPPSAEACGGPVCMGKDIRFPRSANAEVPVNVPALVVLHPHRIQFDTGSFHLRTAEGADVEATVTSGAHGSAALVPTAPLVPGATYRMEATSPCYLEDQTEAATFTVGPALPIPSTSGVLEARPEQHGPFRVHGGSMCSDEVEGSTLSLGFTPAPELVPFLPWVHWTLEVDGKPWAQAEHGAVGPTGEFTVASRLLYNRDLLSLYTVCGDPGSVGGSQDKGLAPGQHVATLRPVLEHSATPLPPVEVSFKLTCPKEPTPPEDKGCSQAGGGLTALGLLTTLQLWRSRSRTRHRA